MNTLLEKNVISELQCGSNFSYILSDNNDFLPTEYKVLQSQANSCFVKCMKMLYNGQTQLFYLTDGLKTMSSLLPMLDADGFVTIVTNLFTDIVDVKHNGFLSCQNIDISFDKIYVEPTTYKVHLVYLPLSKRIFSDTTMMETELRTGLVKLISGISSLSSPKTMQLSVDLCSGMLSFEDVLTKIRGGRVAKPLKPVSTPSVPSHAGKGVRLIAMNSPTKFELIIHKNVYTIGKSDTAVDGTIPFNKMISRVHCRITREGNKLTITDLKSSNGTFVNKIRIQPNVPWPLKHGDIIRLANSDFRVSMG